MPPRPFPSPLSLALTLAALAAGPLQAQPAVPTDGRTCFCLQHGSGESLVGCVGEKGPNDVYATATCWDERRRTRTREVTVDSGWTVVPAGQGFCTPCDPRAPAAPGDDNRGVQPLPGDPTHLPQRPLPLTPRPDQGR